ncbi:cation-translocating P-type ATPase [Candidatus Woesearchaeota archaeon]|nr:cation-translocating P-type ATPase [Candidatus Woesearchaeota archaeon]
MHHAKKTEDVMQDLITGPRGISREEARRRLAQYGPNELKDAKPVSPLVIFLSQFKSIVIWILIAATVISALLKEYIDAIVISVILVLIAILGFIQEYKAEKAIEALKRMASLQATVRRSGEKMKIDAKDLVPGDIILLETGDKVPADARMISSFNLETQEAALTGESLPIRKIMNELPESTPLADRKNMVFSSTIVTSGRGEAVVTGTGMKTEIGRIAKLISEVEKEKTPLQQKLDQLGKWLGVATLAVCFVVFALSVLKNPAAISHLQALNFMEFFREAREMFITAIALAVAAVPEGLPAVVTISLAIGTTRMLKRHALIRKLPSVETLGSTTVICTDKTGTLTLNQMTVKRIFANGKIIDVTGSGYDAIGEFQADGRKIGTREIELILRIGALNNDAELKDGKVIGDPTEGCLIVSAAKAGMPKKDLIEKFPRIDEIGFTSERKMMTTIHRSGKGKIAYSKGAPDVLLRNCSFINANGKVRRLTPKDRKQILDTNSKFAEQALRVLAFAYNPISKKNSKAPEKDMIFVGLQGMIDPPRKEVKSAIEKCRKAGIKIVMITGDHEKTARAIAMELGLDGNSITGEKLEQMDDISGIVDDIAIYARVNPEHKIKIVDALKKKGHIVAMTGDGVNDAPALKKADIGIAMGITGTDVSKEASAMILIDDNFASIVNAVEEGRGTYSNIKKYFAFLISGNLAEVLIIFFGILFGMPLPMTATQILLINLVTDGLPALALSADPFEPNAMARKPRRKDEPIYRDLRAFIIYYPIVMTAAALTVFSWFYYRQQADLLVAQTATFLTISMFELYQAFTCRSTIYPISKVGIFKNKYLVLAVAASVAVIASSIFIGSVGKYLDMAPLTIAQFFTIMLISSAGGIIIEVWKYATSRSEGKISTETPTAAQTA